MTERQLWYLPKKTQIESIQSRRLALSLAIIICGILAAFIIWAYFVRIQELSLAVGEITPVNRISVVEHLEGGLVYQILVDEGSQVKKGQPLAKIDETLAKAELQQLEAKRLTLMSNVEREKSLIEKTDFSPTLPATAVHNNEPDISVNEILERQQQLHQIQSQALNAQQAVIVQQILQREEELLKLRQQLETAKKNAVLHREEVTMFRKLIEPGYISRLDLIRAECSLNTAEGTVTELTKEISIAKQALQEAESRLTELIQTEMQKMADRLQRSQHELFQVQFAIQKLKYHLANTVVRAPIAGTVVNMKITEGKVLAAGGFAMNIVPLNAPLRAEIRIRPADIGFIRIGDPVACKGYGLSFYGDPVAFQEN